MKRTALLGIFLALAACGAPPRSAAPFDSDESVARGQLLAIAPIGSDARQALPILVSQGFTCHWSQQEEAAGLSGRQDYLYCDLERTEGVLVSRRWQLVLVHTNFAIKDARFGISLTGL